MFERFFGKNVKYAIFIHFINDKIVTLEEEFSEKWDEEDIADEMRNRDWIKSESALYSTDQIVSITVRRKEP